MTRNYADILAETEKLFESKRFDEALRVLETLGAESLSPQLRVLRGKCIQLADDSPLPLSEAEKSFRSALELDDRCLAAWIELGYYTLNVADNAKEAEAIFKKAGEVLSSFQAEIARGCGQCREELEGSES